MGLEHTNFYKLLRSYRHLRDKYGVRVKAGRRDKNDHETVSFYRATAYQVVYSLQVLRGELEKYPPSYIRGMRIQRIRLVDNLYDMIEGAGQPDRTDGLITLGDCQIYLDVGLFFDDLRKTLHHELKHRADDVARQKIMNTWRGQAREIFRKDAYSKWIALHPGVEYIGDECWEKYQGFYNKRPQGFENFYGKVSIYEDRATIAEALMMYPEKLFMTGRVDQVLLAKTKVIMRDFHRRSGGLMGPDYFKDLIAGRVKYGYWDRR